MIKVRVIPQLLIADGLLKKPIQFKRPRTVASPVTIARVFEGRHVDELVLIDIGCAAHNQNVNPDVVAQIAEELTVPLAVGGGIRSMDVIARLIAKGAEKVTINSAAVETPELVTAAAQRYGSQAVVVSIDAMRHPDGTYEVFTRNGSNPTGLDPVTWARNVEALGAGEIIINAILQDGTMKGFDIPLTRSVAGAVEIPVVAAGGAGSPEDCVDVVLRGHASAVIVGSLFHFRRTTPDMVKQAMAAKGIPVRLPNAWLEGQRI